MIKVKCEADCKFRGENGLCTKEEISIIVTALYVFDNREIEEERICDDYCMRL